MPFVSEQLTPTGITTSNPIQVTINNHGLQAGDRIRATKFFSNPTIDATGMEQLNNQLFVVMSPTTNTFNLYDIYGNTIDGTNYTPFINNGLAQFTLTGPDLFVENQID